MYEVKKITKTTEITTFKSEIETISEEHVTWAIVYDDISVELSCRFDEILNPIIRIVVDPLGDYQSTTIGSNTISFNLTVTGPKDIVTRKLTDELEKIINTFFMYNRCNDDVSMAIMCQNIGLIIERYK